VRRPVPGAAALADLSAACLPGSLPLPLSPMALDPVAVLLVVGGGGGGDGGGANVRDAGGVAGGGRWWWRR
jgi:hypothetical protein